METSDASRRENAESYSPVVMPRFKRGIQYAVTSRVNANRLWNTGSSAFADDDGRVCGVLAFMRYTFAFPRHDVPEVYKILCPLKSEGAGKAGCPLHPQPRV